MNMTKFLNRRKKNIKTKRYYRFALVTCLLVIEACAQETKNIKQIETVTKAIKFLQNQDSIGFYSLIDTSFVIDLKGREGMSNEVKSAAFFLKKFGIPGTSQYNVINHELTDYKSAEIVVPIVQNGSSPIKDVKIVFEFVRYLPQTKALNFYIEIQSNPQIPNTSPQKIH